MKRESQSASESGIWVAIPVLLAIFLAPFLHGGTTERGLWILDGLCFLGLALCVGRGLLQRTMPHVSKAIWIPVAGLVFLGTFQIAFPHFTFDSGSWTLVPVDGSISWLPGTVDQTLSSEAFRHFLAIVAAALVLLIVSRHRRARWWVLRVVALSGLAVGLIGIGQKAGGAEHMLWSSPLDSGHLFFGAFRYHGNAAAFLNLCWPASLALWLRRCQTVGGDTGKSFWMVAFVVTVSAVFVNSSKAGHVIAGVFLILAAVRFWNQLPLRGRGWASPVAAIVVLLVFVGIAIAPGAATSLEKWDEVMVDGSSWKGRLTAYQICLGMLPDSGLWGTGPGTFRLVFPFYTGDVSGEISGFWYHAHQDYLQTWIEWGAVGFLLFGVLVAGGLYRGIRKVRRLRKRRISEISTSCALLAFGSVALHAMVDFPFQIPALQLPAFAFLAFLWAKGRARRKTVHHAYSIDARMQHTGVNRVRRDLETV